MSDTQPLHPVMTYLRRGLLGRCPGCGEGRMFRAFLKVSDRCDVCGTRGISLFHPFAVRLGPTLIAGDACTNCADRLGIRFSDVAS